jgi:hypothetical protein
MKLKTLTARNGGQLEKEFTDWMSDGIEIDKISIHSDHRGNLMMAIFYEGKEAEKVEVVYKTRTPPPSLVEEILCPCCHTLTRPTTVEMGRWKGRLKCTQCLKTFTKEDAEPGMPTEGATSSNTGPSGSNTGITPPKIGEVTNG